jgi:hypothetical protein
MTSDTATLPPPPAPGGITIDRFDPAPLIARGRNGWTRWAGPVVSLLILVVAFMQLRHVDPTELWALLPASAAFWAVYAVYYLAGPVSEWVIFRRLWSIPGEGLAALMRKMISNELLLGYLGEVYFYAWARRNATVTNAPFGAIKDVAILSALGGNIVTLAMVALAWPLLGAVDAGFNRWEVAGSILFVFALSAVALLLRRRLFSLPRRELIVVFGIQMLRIVGKNLLAAVMWHMMLPAVGLTWWVLLATLRQLLSRLPFLPNKDVVFAGMAAFLIGRDNDIVSAMALMASLILVTHLIVGLCLGVSGLTREGKLQGNRA